jgi:hypothetical protein
VNGHGTRLDLVVQLLADREARADNRDRRQIISREGAGERLIAAGLTLVEDDRRVVPGGLSVLRLDVEVAGSALNQRDLRFGG